MDKKRKPAVSDNQNKVPSISYFILFRFASKWDKFLIVVALLAILAAGITTPYGIALVANIFQTMIDYAKSVEDGPMKANEFLKSMHHFGKTYACVGIVLFIGGYLGTSLMKVAAINQVFKIRVAYLKAALNQDFAYFDLHQTSDFASKMAEDMIKLEEGIGDKVSSLVYNIAVALSCITMAFYKGWKLTLLCLTTAPITLFLVGLTGTISDRLYKKQSKAKGKASAVAEEAISSVKTVYAFNGQQKEIERYKKPLAEARRIYIKKEFFTGLSMGFLFLCIFCSYAVAFYVGIYLVINDPKKYNADVMFSVFFGVMTGLSYFGMIGNLMTSFGSARGAGAEIFNVLDNVPIINPLLDCGLKPRSFDGDIEFKNISFRYPSRPDVTVLSNMNIKILSGQTVALVGHSGCGKSTIIDLISRYYDVLEGSIALDNYDLRDLSVVWLRGQIGLVRQEPVLFNTSIQENIRHGREDASNALIVEAARMANAHEFIVKLPYGYNTIVGDRGASLSGGQKQRIAIARALVRNPRILLLDEATSALDNVSEAKVQEALNEAAKGRTTVIVAHRLSTIRNVDVIFVIENGHVVEKGSHNELLDRRGLYYNMFKRLELSDLKETEMQMDDVLNNVTVARRSDQEQSEMKESLLAFEVAKEDVILKTPPLSFWRVVALNAPEWKTIVLGSFSSIISGFSMPLFILAFGDLFGSMSNPDPSYLMDKVKNISIICIFIGCAMGLSNFIETLSFGAAGAYLTERLRLKMFTHLLREDIEFFDYRENSTGALCARLSAEAAYVQGATGQRIGIILQGIGSVGLAFSLAMWFEWRVGMVALAFLPFVILVIWQEGKVTSKESSGYVKSVEASTKIAMEAVSNIRTVASLGRERSVVRQYSAQLQPALKPARRAAHWRGLVSGLSRSIFNFVNAVALTYGGHLIVSDGVAYQNILITTQSLQMASSQAQNAFAYAPDFQKGIDAASRIANLLQTKPKITDPEQPVDFKKPKPPPPPPKHSTTLTFCRKFDARFAPKPERPQDIDSTTDVGKKPNGDACLKEVEFKYPTRPTARVLYGLNLEIEHGKTTALVGESGCGKSTIVQLLQRYYDPDSGSVALDDIPLNKLLVNDVRSTFGLVSQEPVLFDRSIYDNIEYGDNSRKVTEQEIFEAAKEANIHNFIMSLPLGYETDIGTRGVQLSGGQKQRVAIARSLVRHPKILLLDEATSALDSENEKIVQEALDAAKAGRTCVMIAHRLSTVRDADAICVLNEDRVVERGTHAELIQLKGLYYKLLKG